MKLLKVKNFILFSRRFLWLNGKMYFTVKEKQKKIVWKGSKEDLIHFFDQLYGQQLLKIKSYDEIFSILSHYFVSESGEPMIVEKSASAKMNLMGPKIPDGYNRYMRSIEKLKSRD